MDSQMQIFQSEEFGSLEILMIGDKPHFPASICAAILGYSNPRKAIIDHCRCVTKRDVPHPQSPGKIIEVNFIPEGDLYRLIIRSKLPAAERFERWVFDTVLPSIRRHGAYITENTLLEMLTNAEYSRDLLLSLQEERTRNTALQGLVIDYAPKARYYDIILQSNNAVPVSLIAKDYGMSAVSFNKLLYGLEIQYRVGRTWVLYQQYADKGYTQSQTHPINNGQQSVMYTCWTQRGRLFLYDTLKYYGIVPTIEKGRA